MKGIMYSNQLIPKVMDGTKTQTRRIEKSLEEINKIPDDWRSPLRAVRDFGVAKEGNFIITNKNTLEVNIIKPRYKVGEIVYVKEVHYAYGIWWNEKGKWAFKQYTDNGVLYSESPPQVYGTMPLPRYEWYKRSPLFLPEQFARTFLMIKEVKLERLNNITWKDVLREGVAHNIAVEHPKWMVIDRFKDLWNSIHKDDSWDRNIWVIVYRFEKVNNERF